MRVCVETVCGVNVRRTLLVGSGLQDASQRTHDLLALGNRHRQLDQGRRGKYTPLLANLTIQKRKLLIASHSISELK